jgi:hypothetical protein
MRSATGTILNVVVFKESACFSWREDVNCNDCGNLIASLPCDQVESYFRKLFKGNL